MKYCSLAEPICRMVPVRILMLVLYMLTPYPFFQRKHPAVYADLNKPTVSPSKSGAAQSTIPIYTAQPRFKLDNLRRLEVNNAYLAFVADELMPLSLVDSSSFRHLVGLLNPAYTLPSRKHLSNNLIPELASQVHDDLTQRIEDAKDIFVTVDIWTSRDMRSYIGITGHFVTNMD